jgi:hypothetical protein
MAILALTATSGGTSKKTTQAKGPQPSQPAAPATPAASASAVAQAAIHSNGISSNPAAAAVTTVSATLIPAASSAQSMAVKDSDEKTSVDVLFNAFEQENPESVAAREAREAAEKVEEKQAKDLASKLETNFKATEAAAVASKALSTYTTGKIVTLIKSCLPATCGVIIDQLLTQGISATIKGALNFTPQPIKYKMTASMKGGQVATQCKLKIAGGTCILTLKPPAEDPLDAASTHLHKEVVGNLRQIIEKRFIKQEDLSTQDYMLLLGMVPQAGNEALKTKLAAQLQASMEGDKQAQLSTDEILSLILALPREDLTLIWNGKNPQNNTEVNLTITLPGKARLTLDIRIPSNHREAFAALPFFLQEQIGVQFGKLYPMVQSLLQNSFIFKWRGDGSTFELQFLPQQSVKINKLLLKGPFSGICDTIGSGTVATLPPMIAGQINAEKLTVTLKPPVHVATNKTALPNITIYGLTYGLDKIHTFDMEVSWGFISKRMQIPYDERTSILEAMEIEFVPVLPKK